MQTTTITPSQYAKKKKWTSRNVTKHLQKGTLLNGVIKVTKYGRFYLLEVQHDFLD